MKTRISILVLLIFVAVGACLAFGIANQNTTSVSLIQLIANPDKYDGEFVRVIGVARLEFEGNGIWVTKEHYKYGVTKNSLWIELEYNKLKATEEQLVEFNGKYVLMEGIFNKNNTGHMGMNSGALENVTRYQLWEEIALIDQDSTKN